MSTGMIWPRWFSVAALYALQKSMMLMPWGPNAVPTGGAGVAPPAWIWILTTAASFFFAILIAPFTANALMASLVASRIHRLVPDLHFCCAPTASARGHSLSCAHSAGSVRVLRPAALLLAP